jgi:hypothetical protein
MIIHADLLWIVDYHYLNFLKNNFATVKNNFQKLTIPISSNHWSNCIIQQGWYGNRLYQVYHAKDSSGTCNSM